MTCLLTPSYTEKIRNTDSPPPIILQLEGEVFFTTQSWNVIINVNLKKTLTYIKKIKGLIKNRQEEKDAELKELAMNINLLIKTIDEEIKNIMIHSKKLDKSINQSPWNMFYLWRCFRLYFWSWHRIK